MNSAIITVVGKIGKDAETKETSTGKTVTKFSVAVSSGYGDKKTTDWFEVSYWFKVPDFLKANLVKGNTVLVTGKFQKTVSEYNGKNYEKLSINAFDVQADKPAESRPAQPDLVAGDNDVVPF